MGRLQDRISVPQRITSLLNRRAAVRHATVTTPHRTGAVDDPRSDRLRELVDAQREPPRYREPVFDFGPSPDPRFVFTDCAACGCQTWHRWVGRDLLCDECYSARQADEEWEDEHPYLADQQRTADNDWLY